MKRTWIIFALLCGMVLALAIAPVYGQSFLPALTVDATSNPATPVELDGSGASIATGETATLRLQFTLLESTAISLEAKSDFGSSFTYVSNSARVSYMGDTVPSFNGDFAGIQNESEPTFVFPASRVSVSGSTVSFDFGSVINNDGDADSESILIEYDLVPAAGAVVGAAANITCLVVLDEGLPTELQEGSNPITLTIVDPPGVTVTQSGGSTDVVEGGASDSFTVVLTSEPVSDVTITLTGNQVTTTPTQLTFTAGNWNTAQTVTVTAADDSVVEGTHNGSVSFTVTGGYDGVTVPAVYVIITDNDSAGISVSPDSGLTTTEAGGTAQFSIVLGSQPSADVTIGLTSSDTSEGTVNPDQLVFTRGNWDTPQIVTVTGVDDSTQDGPVAYSIITAAAVSTDTAYSGMNAADVLVTNTDDDSAGLVVAPQTIPLSEGLTGSYTIRLLTAPTASPVTVQVDFPADQLTVNGSSVPFTLALTDTTPQPIPFSVLANGNVNTSRELVIRHTIVSTAAPEYPVGTQAVVTLSVYDTPPPPPSPTCDSENFNENGIVRTGVPDALASAINCRVLYHNGGSTTWLGSPLYGEANLGVPGLLDLGVLQAVDIFSPPPSSLSYFEGGFVMCLQGEGSLIWLAARHSPRIAEIIGSYPVPEFPGFTCATLFEPGTLILVSENPASP